MAGDSTTLTLVMDTAATIGFDDGLDVLCSADSGGGEACLLIDSTLYLTSYIPSNGDWAIHWAVQLITGDSAATLTMDLGEFPLDSASFGWMDSTGMVMQDLLMDSVFLVPDSLGTVCLLYTSDAADEV